SPSSVCSGTQCPSPYTLQDGRRVVRNRKDRETCRDNRTLAWPDLRRPGMGGVLPNKPATWLRWRDGRRSCSWVYEELIDTVASADSEFNTRRKAPTRIGTTVKSS